MLKKVYAALKSLTGAERVYQVVFLEGIPHFPGWLVRAVKAYEDWKCDPSAARPWDEIDDALDIIWFSVIL